MMRRALNALAYVFAAALLGGEIAFVLGFFLLAFTAHRGR